MFGIDPTAMALTPSTVLQNIIQKKQLAARERERATQEKLALKRIAAQEAAAAEQTRQFEISQAGRGALSEHQKWLQENWGKLTPQQQAEEARKAETYEAEKTARQQAMDETARITEGLAEPTTQPVIQTQPTVQPAQDLTTITPQAGFEGLPDYLKRQPAPVAPAIAPAVAPKVYTPPADIAGYLEQFPDRKANLETAQTRIQPLKLTKREKLLIDLQTLDQTNLPKSRKDSLIAQNKEIKARRKQNFELEKGIRDEHTSMRKEQKAQQKELAKELKPKDFTPIQKQKIDGVRANLKRSKRVVKEFGVSKTIKVNSLDEALDYIIAEDFSPELFTKELAKWGGDEQKNIKEAYNKLRASGVGREEAMRRLGL